MEKQASVPQGRINRIILSIYVAVCTLLVLIILLAPFQSKDSGIRQQEIYLNVSTSETNGQ